MSKPNILFAISDDQSWPHAGAYGCEFVNTPVFDRIAKEGILFENAFCNSPQCAPARAVALTGLNMWRLEEASLLLSKFPKKFKAYPEILEENGYHVGYTGKPWGPGNLEASGRKRNPAGNAYGGLSGFSYQIPSGDKGTGKNTNFIDPPTDGILNNDYFENFKEFLKDRESNQPFCFWYGCKEPHRTYEYGSGLNAGKKLEEVKVPKFFPDTKKVRTDLLDYAYEIEWFDKQLGKMLEYLEKINELEDTIVIATSDNGMPFPRIKANLYPQSCHVPFALRWGKKTGGKRKVTDFISLADLAPTFLEAAGIEKDIDFSGKSLMPIIEAQKSGRIDKKRNKVFNGRERHTPCRPDLKCYPSRSIQTDRYLYIKNYKPDLWPVGNPITNYADCDDGPTKMYILAHKNEKYVSDKFRLCFRKRPAEELYDIKNDLYCLNNLANETKYKEIKEKLKKDLEKKLKSEKDPRELGYGEIFDSYPCYSNSFSWLDKLSGFTKLNTYNTELKEKAEENMNRY